MEKSTQSILMATATGAMVLGVFNGVAPSISDVSESAADVASVNTNTRVASWLSAGLVGGISILMRDPTIFTVGAMEIVGLNLWLRSANHSNPTSMAGAAVSSIILPAERPITAPTAADQGSGTPMVSTSSYSSF